MFTKPIFETLPIAVIAAGILLILLLHTLLAFLVGVVFIAAACISLYRRLDQLGTDPDVMDYIEPTNHKF
jgi:hypothetical protein